MDKTTGKGRARGKPPGMSVRGRADVISCGPGPKYSAQKKAHVINSQDCQDVVDYLSQNKSSSTANSATTSTTSATFDTLHFVFYLYAECLPGFYSDIFWFGLRLLMLPGCCADPVSILLLDPEQACSSGVSDSSLTRLHTCLFQVWDSGTTAAKAITRTARQLVYHIDSDSYETQNQHYGRTLTKETVKEGISKFFHNGCCLRKDAVSVCLQKVKLILNWFENQDILHFYASSLLFVYDASYPQTPKSPVDGKILDKIDIPKELFTDVEVPECNNNINMVSSMGGGKEEERTEKKIPRSYTTQKKTCPKRLHSQAFTEGESVEQDRSWKSQNVPLEHLNGNRLSKLENVFCHVSTEPRESSQVDVRMIDFAHVFPNNGKDTGYIYGLKNLISVLQSILNE
ncbi:inositol polyphosphate multikinase-like [Hyperolius riggenbachi]|uniref:inositol polyphosphate multikinase-like n=1 Tax=Hyperolius riggenbachi TaxID=752182 RepID=UPI0035A3124C